MSILTKLQSTIPDLYKPQSNPVILALLTAIAQSDENLVTQANNARDQLFVKTANGQGLDRAGKSLGVFRPKNLSLSDATFRELIPNLSFKPKQIKKAFYDTADVFWGKDITRANIITSNADTFNIQIGDILNLKVDGGDIQTFKIVTGDVTIGVATPEQMQIWLQKFKGLEVEIFTDGVTGAEHIHLRTKAPGAIGSIEILSSSILGATKLGFTVKEHVLQDLPQRFSIYNVRSNELVIEIPITVPIIKDTLFGSHHFHINATLESPQPPNNGIWAGSFLYSPSGNNGDFEVSAQVTTLTTKIVAGVGIQSISLTDTSQFTTPFGHLIFDFGKVDQETPIAFTSILNSTTVAVNPNTPFQKTHEIGINVNVLVSNQAKTPRTNGSDLGVYLNSPANNLIIVEGLLQKLKAAGIILIFKPSRPQYKYLIDSPYT